MFEYSRLSSVRCSQLSDFFTHANYISSMDAIRDLSPSEYSDFKKHVLSLSSDYKICIHCHKPVKTGVFVVNHGFFCNECKDRMLIQCPECENFILEFETVTTPDDVELCRNCFFDKFFVCECCGESILLDDNFGNGYIDLCENCRDEHYNRCSSCEELFHRDDLYFHEYENDYFCNECYPEEPDNECFLKNNWDNMVNSSFFTCENNLNAVGIELECIVNDNSFEKNRKELKNFKIVADASISSECGIELVSCPMPLKDVYSTVKECCDYTKQYCSIDSSCGYHAHFFVHNSFLNIDNVKKILFAYSKLEKLFFDSVPKSRRNNRFCNSINTRDNTIMRIPYLEDVDSLGRFLTIFYESAHTDKLENIPMDKYHNKRYYWVNLHSLFYRNTIEIRLHSATLNHKKVYSWLMIHKKLLEYCFSNSVETVKKLDIHTFLYKVLNRNLRLYLLRRIDRFSTSDYDYDAPSYSEHVETNNRITAGLCELWG